jgi:uncharacterized RDD family membrane protein YckC
MSAPDSIALELTTPENVPLPFELASVSHRLLALLLDLLLLGALLVAALGVVLGGMWLFGAGGAGCVSALAILVSFFIRNFYFAFSELHWHGQTLAKRSMGLRVIARDGGPLTAKMVVSRNLTRELEIFLPIVALYAPEALYGGASTWVRPLCGMWMLLLGLLPLFNRQRARLGDLVAGTLVVLAPSSKLLPDLVTAPASGGFRFTREQLEIYGIKELQVLEKVLRRDVVADALLFDIAERIKRKISWDPRYWNVPPEPFLRAFYAAQRSRLEQKMLMGKRQEKKIR